MTPKDAAVDAVARPAMAVLGAGSWGTALAVHLARTGHPTVLWGRDVAQMASFAAARCNTRYLPMAPFPASLVIESDLPRAVASAQDLLVAVPSHGFRECLEHVAPLLRNGMRLSWATKGFELDTGKLPHQVANEVLGIAVPKTYDEVLAAAEKIKASKDEKILLEDMFASVARTGFPWKECIGKYLVRVERAL